MRSAFWGWSCTPLSLPCPCWQWACSDSIRKTNVNNCYRHLTSLGWGSWDFSHWDIAHFPDWHHAWTRLWKCLWDEASRQEVEPEHCSIIFNCCPNVKQDDVVRIFLDMVFPKALLSIEVYLVQSLYSCILSLFPRHHTFSVNEAFINILSSCTALTLSHHFFTPAVLTNKTIHIFSCWSRLETVQADLSLSSLSLVRNPKALQNLNVIWD